jgi:hypothetical protein
MLGTETCLHGSDGKSPKERNHLESTGNERVILKHVENMMGVVCGMVRVAQDVLVAGFCEHGNEFWVP